MRHSSGGIHRLPRNLITIFTTNYPDQDCRQINASRGPFATTAGLCRFWLRHWITK